MRINSIELEGFQSYRDKERIDLDGIALAAVIGPNHVGKSTMVSDGLMYALFGSSRGAVINDIITRGQQKATVTLEFTVRGTRYRITRFRTRKGRSEAHVYVQDESYAGGWRDLSEKNPASADDTLADLIGMNAETARLTWMISQGDFGAFCELKPAPRRAALAEAFGLDKYGVLARSAETRRRELSSELLTRRADLANAQQRLTELNVPGAYPHYDDVELDKAATEAESQAEKHAGMLAHTDTAAADAALTDARANMDAFDRATQRAQQQHSQAVTRLDNLIRQGEAAVRDAQRGLDAIAAAEQNLTENLHRVEQITDRGKRQAEAVDQLRARAAEVAAAPQLMKQQLDGVQAQGQEISEQIATLENGLHQGQGECWTCGQHLSEQDARLLIAAKDEQRQQLKAQWQQISQQMKDAQREFADLSAKVRSEEGSLESLRAELQQAHAAAARAEQTVSTREQAELRARQVQAALESARSERDEVGPAPEVDGEQRHRLAQALTKAQDAADNARAGQERREEIEASMHQAREESRRLWQEKQRRATVAEELEKLRPRAEKLSKDVEALEVQVSDHDLLVEAFRPSGIPSMILAGVVEELNEDANEVLGYLGDDGLGVRITTQREKAGGGVDEKVMIYVVTADGEADYKTLSGSEKFRVALAVRVGLAQCIARRTGTPVETIVMDEGWGALDDETKIAVQDVLTRLSQNFNVYTVSHIDDVRSAFPTVIEVSADTGTSRCTIRTIS